MLSILLVILDRSVIVLNKIVTQILGDGESSPVSAIYMSVLQTYTDSKWHGIAMMII